MRPYIAFAVTFAACGVLFYLFGAFCSLSFNIADWSDQARYTTCVIETLLGGFVSSFVAVRENLR